MRNAGFRRKWDEAFAHLDGKPRAQLRVIRTTQPRYRGCPFINFRAEFPETSHPGHQVAEANKREMRRRFLRIAEALDVARPKQVVEGAYAISQTLGGRKGPGHALLWAAEALVEERRD